VFGPLREKGFHNYYVFALTVAEKRIGTLGVGSRIPRAYTKDDERWLRRVAELVAVAVETASTREE
jgi:GAF domain-containing protein